MQRQYISRFSKTRVKGKNTFSREITLTVYFLLRAAHERKEFARQTIHTKYQVLFLFEE